MLSKNIDTSPVAYNTEKYNTIASETEAVK